MINKNTLICFLIFGLSFYGNSIFSMQSAKQLMPAEFLDQLFLNQIPSMYPQDMTSIIISHYYSDIAQWTTGTFVSHASELHDIALSDNEDTIACALENGNVMVFNSHDLSKRKKEKLGTVRILSSKLYSKKSKLLLLTGSDNGKVFLKDIIGNKIYAEIHHGKRTNAIDYDMHNKKIVTGSSDEKACIWDCAKKNNPQLLITLPHEGLVWKVQFSKNGAYVATAALDGKARVFNTTTGKLLCCVRHDAQNVCFVKFLKDDTAIISGGDDGCIKITDIASNQLKTCFITENRSAIYMLAVACNDNIIAARSQEGHIYVWDLSKENTLVFCHHSEDLENDAVFSLALNKEGTLLAAGLDNKKLYLWDLKTKQMMTKGPFVGSINSILVNKDSTELLIGVNDNTIGFVKRYTSEQEALRKLLFLWSMVKKVPSNVTVLEYIDNICQHIFVLSIDCLKNIWATLDEEEQSDIWSKIIAPFMPELSKKKRKRQTECHLTEKTYKKSKK